MVKLACHFFLQMRCFIAARSCTLLIALAMLQFISIFATAVKEVAAVKTAAGNNSPGTRGEPRSPPANNLIAKRGPTLLSTVDGMGWISPSLLLSPFRPSLSHSPALSPLAEIPLPGAKWAVKTGAEKKGGR